MNAQTTLNAAIAAGFDRLSTRDAMLCILYGAGGGDYSGSGAPSAQTPPPVPTGSGGTYWDYTNKILYMWNPVSKSWEQ